MTHRKVFLLLGVALALAAGLFAFIHREQRLSTMDVAGAQIPAGQNSESEGFRPERSSSQREVPQASTSSRADTVAAKPEPKGARSREDAAWLAERWYPTEEDVANAKVNPDLPLDRMPTSAEDLAVAWLLLGSEDHDAAARETLDNGAMLGSSYALIAMGIYLELRSPVDAQAYFRAAIMLGDWMVAIRPKQSLDTYSDGLASASALKILEDLDQRRLQRGLPPLRREVRPGLDSFLIDLRAISEEIRAAQAEGLVSPPEG